MRTRWGVAAGVAYLLLSLMLTVPVLAGAKAPEDSVVAPVEAAHAEALGAPYEASFSAAKIAPPGLVGLMMGAGLLGLYFCSSRPEPRR